MSDFLELFERMLDRELWIRIFYVVLGALLIYYALMSSQNRLLG